MAGCLNVIRHDRFIERMKEFSFVRRLEDYIKGYEFMLARNPEKERCRIVNGRKIFVISYHLDPTLLKEIVIYYTFDDSNVYLLDMRLRDCRDSE